MQEFVGLCALSGLACFEEQKQGVEAGEEAGQVCGWIEDGVEGWRFVFLKVGVLSSARREEKS